MAARRKNFICRMSVSKFSITKIIHVVVSSSVSSLIFFFFFIIVSSLLSPSDVRATSERLRLADPLGLRMRATGNETFYFDRLHAFLFVCLFWGGGG